MRASHTAKSRRRRRWARTGLVLLVLVAAQAAGVGREIRGLSAVMKAVAPPPHTMASRLPLLDHVEARIRSAELDGHALRAYHATRLTPLMSALDTHMAVDRSQLSRIAIALVREGNASGIDPRLLLAVLLVENPWLDPTARSPVGAVGLMQVMPFHAGNWGCAGDDLTDPDHNICHGARILADALARSGGDLDRALLRYNGCVRGSNTPDCHAYPRWVYHRAGEQWMAEIHPLLDDPPRTDVAGESPM